MHNVIGVVMVSVGDEHLLTEQFIGLVRLEYRTRPYRGQVRTSLRFGQVHRSCPFARHHLWQLRGLQHITTRKLHCLDGALRQEWTESESHVRRMPHFLNGSRDKWGQALASKFSAFGKPVPSILGEPAISFLESRWGLYAAIGKTHRALPISGLI